MSSQIVPFVDGNDTPSTQPHHNTWKPSNTGKGKAVVVEHAILRRPLGPIQDDVRPNFELLGLPSNEEFDKQRRLWVEADLIGGNHDMRHSLSPKKGPKCITKFNPTSKFLKPLLEKIKEPSVLQLRGCDQLFSPFVSPFSFEKFKALICLEISSVSNFTTFPENTISEMTQLQFLNLSHLPIQHLPTDFLSNLVHLRSLTLKDCPNIHSLPELPQMTALEYLELSHLLIPQLPTDFFSKLVNLCSLTLKDCPNIHSLPELSQMTALEYLELSHLLITTLPYGCFFRLKKLERLILRGCSKLSSLPTFESTSYLRELDLSHCIALQEKELEKLCWTITKLDLSSTDLLKLFGTTKPSKYMSITHLFLRDTKVINFRSFPIEYLRLLHVLDVSGSQCVNDLDLLKTSILALVALDLSRTRFEFGYPIDFISFMEYLRYLILRDCTWLQKLPSMKNLTHLEVLDISGCENLGDLPEDFSSLKNLKELNLSGCSRLKDLNPALFGEMTFLEKVDISKTGINYLLSFARLPNLRTLNISQTSVKEVPTCLQTVTNLDTLDLHPSLSKPNEFYIISTFSINSGFDRFKQHFDVIVDLISRFRENFEPVSSLDTIPILDVELIDSADKRIKNDAESCPIGGQTVKMQCRRMVADLEYIRDNIGLLEICPSRTIAENLLDELTGARSQFEPWIFEEDGPSQHFYFRLNSINFYEVLRRVTKLKLLVPRKGVDALEEKKNKEKEKLEERLGDKQEDEEDVDINNPEMQKLSSSYESLTNTQKNCLLHFTVFKDWIKERMLIQLWYGEGLIDPQHEENVGLSNANSTPSSWPTPKQNLNFDPTADRNQEIATKCLDESDRNQEIATEYLDEPDHNQEIAAAYSDESDPNQEIAAGYSDESDPNQEITAEYSDEPDPNQEITAGYSDESDPNQEITTGYSDESDPNQEITAEYSHESDPNQEITAEYSHESDPNQEIAAGYSDESDPHQEIAARYSDESDPNQEIAARYSDESDPNQEIAARYSDESDPNQDIAAEYSEQSDPNQEIAAEYSDESDHNKEIAAEYSDESDPNKEIAAEYSDESDPNQEITAEYSDESYPNQEITAEYSHESDPNQEITSASIEVGTTSTTFWQKVEEIGQKILMVLEEKHFIEKFYSGVRITSPLWSLILSADVYSFVRARAMAEGFFNVDHETRMLTPHLSIGLERACLLISQNNLPSSCKLWADYTNSSEKIECFKTIRTLLNVNACIVDIKVDWFSKMRDLSVFHLGRLQKRKDDHKSIEVMDLKFLEELKNMKKLRLLNLEGFLAIKKLPDSICKVTNLRILNLRECGYLEELPAGIGSLNNLTHLDLTDCRILPMLPKGIRRLSKLEVLKGFIITYQIGGRQHRHACTLRDLLKLDKLRILKLVVHTEGFPFPDSSDLHILSRMKNLCNLRIEWQHNYNALDQQHQDIVGQKTTSRWHWHRLKCCQPVSCFFRKHVFLFHLFLNRLEQRMNQNDTVEEILRSNIKKLELRCFPFETAPNWLQPSGLQKLERLYVRGGKLKTLAINTDQDMWSVKFLSLRYLRNMYMNGEEFRCYFPHMTYFESYECDHFPPRRGELKFTSDEGILVHNSNQVNYWLPWSRNYFQANE